MTEDLTNLTHDQDRKSWVESANDPATDFPIQNLPYGLFRWRGSGASKVGIAIGNQILDVGAAVEAGLLKGVAAEACREENLDGIMAEGAEERSVLRSDISNMLRAGTKLGNEAKEIAEKLIIPMADVELEVPMEVRDFSDFHASIFHATNVGKMLRPDQPLLPNYKYAPVGYHGRASSIQISGTPFCRPVGQQCPKGDEPPPFGPTEQLDYELELGVVVGPATLHEQPLMLEEAENHIFGFCLLNDWSAWDIQAWEHQPLGPFLSKSFASTISPWIVTLDALAPFRTQAYRRPEGDPAPLPYLSSERNETLGGLDIELEVHYTTERMREQGMEPFLVNKAKFAQMYWSVFQLLAHHTSNGCGLSVGDLLGSGTVSSAGPGEVGSLIERTHGGTEPIELPTGEKRGFVEDGDEVVLRASCQREGYRRIGFGECVAEVLPPSAL